MKTIKYQSVFSIKKPLLYTSLLCVIMGCTWLTSCNSFFESESNRLMYDNENTLSSENDSVYSVLGILTKLQNVADRYVLLGELRGDLVQVNQYTETPLRELADFTADVDNKYNCIKDYYSIINNCNYYITRCDTAKAFMRRECAAVKGIRAWTYLQMVLNYGQVTYYTEPILSVEDSQKEYPIYSLDDLCPILIEDITPYKDVSMPSYGNIFSIDSRFIYLPISLLIGELNLWAGNYYAAAAAYYDYICKQKLYISPSIKISYRDINLRSYTNSWSSIFGAAISGEVISIIPMAVDAAQGKTSSLSGLFSTLDDTQQISPSDSWIKTCEEQAYLFQNESSNIYSSGDLRCPGSLSGIWLSGMLIDTGCISKHTQLKQYSQIILYRTPHVYLRFAEACNRAGFPSLAFSVLKYGLTPENIAKYVTVSERAQNPPFMDFSNESFSNNTALHSRGCGYTPKNERYVQHFDIEKIDTITMLPIDQAIITADSLSIIDSVEMYICTEYALETAFEGNRFQDLMRIAKHRNDPSFLASIIARRNGTFDAALYTKLLDEKNWYLPNK